MYINLKEIQNSLEPKQKYAKLQPGKNHLRFVKTDGLFKHSGFHTLNGGYQICPKRTDKLPCPICEAASEAYRNSTFKNKSEDPLYKALKAADRYYWACVDRGSDRGIQILSLGSKITKSIVDTMVAWAPKDPLDPDTGNDVVITKTGSGLLTSYDFTFLPQSSPLGTPEEVEQWMSEMPDLNAECRYLSYDELEKMLKSFLVSQGTGQIITPQAVVTPSGAASFKTDKEASRIFDMLAKTNQ